MNRILNASHEFRVISIHSIGRKLELLQNSKIKTEKIPQIQGVLVFAVLALLNIRVVHVAF